MTDRRFRFFRPLASVSRRILARRTKLGRAELAKTRDSRRKRRSLTKFKGYRASSGFDDPYCPAPVRAPGPPQEKFMFIGRVRPRIERDLDLTGSNDFRGQTRQNQNMQNTPAGAEGKTKYTRSEAIQCSGLESPGSDARSPGQLGGGKTSPMPRWNRKAAERVDSPMNTHASRLRGGAKPTETTQIIHEKAYFVGRPVGPGMQG